MSASFLGVQIDAVYHTALVFGGIEYFFGGGVQTSYPGATHHGKPMEIIPMGTTHLLIEVILEYLESLKEVYTMESYDLFLHNYTPFGQMLKPQLDQAMRGITQAPVPAQSVPQPNRQPQASSNGHSSLPQTNGFKEKEHVPGVVYKPTRIKQLDELLASAQSTCAVIFFTSATCPPCKIVYPAYDELAAAAGNKACLIKVDLTEAYEIGAKYQVRVTPTFMTFLKGEKENEWSGANESQLRGNVNLLIQMAHPAHPHTLLSVPILRRPHKAPVTYTKVPPIDKLISKMGPSGSDPTVNALKGFVTSRQKSGAADARLPALPDLSAFLVHCMKTSPPENLFPVVDLFRVALVDPRLSGYFAEDSHHTVRAILLKVSELDASCPYQLRIVTLHMACNLFTSPLFPPKLLSEQSLSAPLLQLVTSSLLDTDHPPVRVAAASLAFNIAASNHHRRLAEQEDFLPQEGQVELVASLLEAMGRERESKDGLRGLLLAVGLLKYMAPKGGEVDDLCEAVGAKDVVAETKGAFVDLKELAKEVELVMK
ncbi:desumoylating isopeptidase 1, partial [Lecanoromycetidae sp. Uapishka_2]